MKGVISKLFLKHGVNQKHQKWFFKDLWSTLFFDKSDVKTCKGDLNRQSGIFFKSWVIKKTYHYEKIQCTILQ